MSKLEEIRPSVSNLKLSIPSLQAYLTRLCKTSKAGRISNYISAWANITSDKEILDDICGLKIDLSETPAQNYFTPTKFNSEETQHITIEINKMLQKQVIQCTNHVQGEIISNIFTRPKKDGTHRIILNLKDFNECVSYHHFKMDSLHTIIKLVDKNCFMASLDLKDAYYSIAIREIDRRFLKFYWQEKLYQFTCLPNGLSSGPRKFTKILKPPLAVLHAKGHIIAGHLDDFYLQGKNYDACCLNLVDTMTLFTQLGLLVHPEKSQFNPSQEIVILGFIINSITMIVKLTSEKTLDLKLACGTFIKNNPKKISIRAVAQIIGRLVASFPGVLYGPLYFRQLEKDKTLALAKSHGNFDAPIHLSDQALSELRWWHANISGSFKPIQQDQASLVITTDASKKGWGAECQGVPTGGLWSHSEAKEHINFLELFASFLGLKTFARTKHDTHIRLMIDNTSAVSIINKMGTSHSDKCNDLAKQLWEWCIARNIWASAAHIPGKENFVADFESRHNQRQSEWMLDKSQLTHALKDLNYFPIIDLFASRLNHQFDNYVSYRPDPQASSIDAFTLLWGPLMFYAFPPFSLVGTVLCKITQERATGVVVIPNWPTQPWYAKVLLMLKRPPVQLKASKRLLTLPSHPEEIHPLYKKLSLMVCLLSGAN